MRAAVRLRFLGGTQAEGWARERAAGERGRQPLRRAPSSPDTSPYTGEAIIRQLLPPRARGSGFCARRELPISLTDLRK